MKQHFAGIVLLFIWTFDNSHVSGYNIETKKIGLVTGSKGSQFGYSVAFVNEPGWIEKQQRGSKFDKVLLVGAPNTTVDDIKGYGDVQKCSYLRTENITCTSLNVKEVGESLCDWIRRNRPNNTNCEEDQRLGATIAVNRNFSNLMNKIDTVPMVTICAPGWKNTFQEESEDKFQKYMIGTCLKLRGNLKVLNCNWLNSKEYCWPFWPQRNSSYHMGKPYLTYAEAGLAADFMKDGLFEVIAAPGVREWRGSLLPVYINDWLSNTLDHQTLGGFKSKSFTKEVSWRDYPTTQYYGYSIATGRFKVQNCNVVAGVPNFFDKNNGNLGKIEVLKDANKQKEAVFGEKRECDGIPLADMKSITTDQVGSKFGAAVAAVDITGDNYDEIFVGAALYSGDQTEEGRVFVYTTTNDSLCGPIGILSGSAKIKNFRKEANYARFGTSIASAGDLNDDLYQDIVIGAPYEDIGRGAVYIYHGIGQCNCLMEDKYSQRITGRELDSRLRAFGWHLYGDDDVDHNKYPDLAVGAYASDQAVVLRTRPIVFLDFEIELQPNPIPLNGSSFPCSGDNVALCVNVTVHFKLYGKGLVSPLNISFDLKADIVYHQKNGDSRFLFRETDTNHILVNLTVCNNTIENYQLDVKKGSNTVEPRDIWTIVRMEGKLELLQSSNPSFDGLDPVLSERVKRHRQADAGFEINCDYLEDCISDLRLKVDLYLLIGIRLKEVTRDTVIHVDESNEMLMKVDVTNLNSSSYGSNFTSLAGILLKRGVTLSELGAVDATCKSSYQNVSSRLNCLADTKLDKYENIKVKAGFDISRARLMSGDKIENLQPFIEINVTAGQANTDVDLTNNVFTINLPVKLKYKMEISFDKHTSDQLRYSADEQSAKIFTIVHRYYITNEGPSMVPWTYVNFTVPLAMQGIVYAKLKAMSQGCYKESKEFQIQTTATNFPLQTPNSHLRGKEFEQHESPGYQTETVGDDVIIDEGTKTVLNITCSDGRYTCVKINCNVTNLVKFRQEIINITIDINEKSLAKAKSKKEISYGSTAIVTDPYVWFGDKVVPLDKAPFIEKYTTFIVKPATVSTEISIWVLIGSVHGALFLLFVIVIILSKVGFFTRKKHDRVKKWKHESLYKRRSRTSSSQTRYNPMEN